MAVRRRPDLGWSGRFRRRPGTQPRAVRTRRDRCRWQASPGCGLARQPEALTTTAASPAGFRTALPPSTTGQAGVRTPKPRTGCGSGRTGRVGVLACGSFLDVSRPLAAASALVCTDVVVVDLRWGPSSDLSFPPAVGWGRVFGCWGGRFGGGSGGWFGGWVSVVVVGDDG